MNERGKQEDKKVKKPSEQILLTEYQACGEAVRLHISRYWVVAGIFMAINTALLGGAASVIITGSTSTHESIKWLVLGFGLALILIILFLILWAKRVNWLIRIHYHRMQEIEGDLGMLTNLTINWLDKHEEEVPGEQKTRYDYLHKRFRRWPTETPFIFVIFGIVITLWITIITMSFCIFDC